MSRNQRLGLLGLLIVIVVAGFMIAGSGGGGSKKKATATATITVRGGKPVGGIKHIAVTRGVRVRFTVRSDVGDEVHVHGYDLHKEVAAGGSVSFDFRATTDGIFVIELEKRSEQIASLKVQP